MEVYTTEEEQVDAIKKWWKENGKSVIWGFVIGSILVGAYQFWVSHREAQMASASIEFEQLLKEIDQNKYDAIIERGGYLIDNFSESSYATMSALMIAKANLEQEDGTAAAEMYRWVISHAADSGMVDIARLRLARVLLVLNKPADALELLDKVAVEPNTATYAETKGDIYVELDQPEMARELYAKALSLAPEQNDNIFLKMKMDNLGI